MQAGMDEIVSAMAMSATQLGENLASLLKRNVPAGARTMPKDLAYNYVKGEASHNTFSFQPYPTPLPLSFLNISPMPDVANQTCQPANRWRSTIHKFLAYSLYPTSAFMHVHRHCHQDRPYFGPLEGCVRLNVDL